MTRISWALVAGVGLALLASGFAACGIDEGGLLPSDGSILDTKGADAQGDVVIDSLPPVSCGQADGSVDASCLGITLPAGWRPIAVQVGQTTVLCSPDGGGFANVEYATNPVVDGNNCVCTGCSPTGAWTCGGTLGAGGTSCNLDTQAVGSAPYCWTDNRVTFTAAIARSGTVTCTSTYYAQGASATPIAGCVPTACEADFCGLVQSGFELCAFNAAVTDGGCPPGLKTSHVVGTNPHAVCNACPPCSVENADASCSASLTTFDNTTCDGGVVSSGNANTGCNIPTGVPVWKSLYYLPTIPVPSCTGGPSNPGGTPALDTPMTVCCVK